MSMPLGQTRTFVARDHAMIGPDGHVVAALPGWRNTQGVILISPVMGASFCQYLAMLVAGSASAFPGAGAGVERVVFVRDGQVQLAAENRTHTLKAGGYAFLPPDMPHEITAAANATLIVFEQRYQAIPGVPLPGVVVGHCSDSGVAAEPFMGDDTAMLAKLLPDNPSFDLAVNVFTFQPGAALPLVETHVFEHGLYMTQGQGIYHLADRWYPVQAGDAIWMGPYCPQWFCAIGKGPAQYLYSKNINRDPLA